MPIEPHLWADDLMAAVAWYRTVLGFAEVARNPQDDPTWFELARGDARLMVAITPDERQAQGNQSYLAAVRERMDGPGGPVSLYLHVDDVDAVWAAATAVGADVREEIWDAWWGGRQFTVADPAGTWWTVFQSSNAE